MSGRLRLGEVGKANVSCFYEPFRTVTFNIGFNNDKPTSG